MEIACESAAITIGQVFCRHDDEDQRNGDHQETERDVAGVLNTSLPRREPSWIDPIDRSGAQDEGKITEGIEDGVRHCGEQRQRARSNGSVDLQNRQAAVGLQESRREVSDMRLHRTGVANKASAEKTYDERSMHCDLILQALAILLLLGLAHVVIDGFQQPLDVLVLRFIESFQLALLDAFLDGDAALARDVGADLAKLVGGFEAMTKTIGVVGLVVAGE